MKYSRLSLSPGRPSIPLPLLYKLDAELSLSFSPTRAHSHFLALSRSPLLPEFTVVAGVRRSSPELAPPEPARRRGPLPASLARPTSRLSHLHFPAQARTQGGRQPQINLCIFEILFIQFMNCMFILLQYEHVWPEIHMYVRYGIFGRYMWLLVHRDCSC
jgi:hypothetical protein